MLKCSSGAAVPPQLWGEGHPKEQGMQLPARHRSSVRETRICDVGWDGWVSLITCSKGGVSTLICGSDLRSQNRFHSCHQCLI